MLMNELDERLTEARLKTRIVFICYYDTMWAPTTVKLKNPDRFSLLVAAITRDYTKPVTMNLDTSKLELTEYRLNHNDLPTNVDHYIAHGKNWMDCCNVSSLVYEYHYCWPHYRDFGILKAAKIIYDDIRGYHSNGLGGLIEDGTQRGFFPNGFSYYVYASTLHNTDVDFDSLKEDYFRTAYGEDYKEVLAFFEKLEQTVDFNYMSKQTDFINPAFTDSFRKVPDVAKEFLPFVKAHKNMPYRSQTVAYRLLAKYLDWIMGVSEALAVMSEGKVDEAKTCYTDFMNYFGQYELEMERYYDHNMCYYSIENILTRKIFA
jgi:hypothetical protein